MEITEVKVFPIQEEKLKAFVSIVFDQWVIDGAVNGLAASARACGERMRRMASGNIAHYGLWMGAAAALIAFLFLRRIG